MTAPNGDQKDQAKAKDAPAQDAPAEKTEEQKRNEESAKLAAEQSKKDAEDRENGVYGRAADDKLGGESFQYGHQPE